MSRRRDLQAAGGWARALSRPGASLLVLSLLAGCNAVLGLDASTLEEGAGTGTTTSSASSSATSTSSSSSTASVGGSGGEGGETSAGGGAGGGGADAGGAGGGGSDPCGAGTWGLLENGGFECGVDPWKADEVGAQLETFSPGYGDRGSAARFRTPDETSNVVYQPIGRVDVDASTCLVASYASRSSDASGQIAPSILLMDSPGHFVVGRHRLMGTSFFYRQGESCRIPAELAGTWTARFYFDVFGLTDATTTVSIDSVSATLVPCEGGEDECDLPSG